MRSAVVSTLAKIWLHDKLPGDFFFSLPSCSKTTFKRMKGAENGGLNSLLTKQQ